MVDHRAESPWHEYRGLLNKLERMRRKKGISQAEIASVCKISQSQLSRIMSAKVPLTVGKLIKYLRCLGLTLEDFFCKGDGNAYQD